MAIEREGLDRGAHTACHYMSRGSGRRCFRDDEMNAGAAQPICSCVPVLMIAAMCAVTVVLALTKHNGIVATIACWSFLRARERISYSAYLTHTGIPPPDSASFAAAHYGLAGCGDDRVGAGDNGGNRSNFVEILRKTAYRSRSPIAIRGLPTCPAAARLIHLPAYNNLISTIPAEPINACSTS